MFQKGNFHLLQVKMYWHFEFFFQRKIWLREYDNSFALTQLHQEI